MSLDGTSNTFIPYTINGINPVAGSINTTNFVKYSGNTSNTDLGTFDLTTAGTISAQQFAIPDNNSNDESWISYTVSTMGNPSTTGGLITTNITSGSTMYFTGDVLGAPNFQFTTLGNAGKVVCTNGNSVFSTTISAGQLDYITALTSQAGGVGQNNTWTGTNDFTTLTSVGALRITSSIANNDYSLSVNSFDQLEFRNITTGNTMTTTGDALAILNINAGGTITTGNIEVAGNSYLIGTGTDQWAQSALSGDYEIKDDVGDTRLALSKTTGLTISTLNVTAVPSATPTLALGLNGSGGVVSFTVPNTAGLVPYTGATTTVNLGSQNLFANTARFTNVVSATPTLALGVDGSGNLNTFAVPSAGGTVNTSTTTARFIPYLSTATTLTNSLLNQIDNDSMGFGYTTIPNYPLGSGGKNMYINGSIFAGGLNSMVGTFGRDTNTSNPANEITFTAGGSGILLSQIKSHSGSSPFVDATWTYSNTNPAPLGANQGQVLLTAKNLNVSGIGNIYSGNPFAVPNSYMQTGSLTIGDCSLNYGGGTTLWSNNTAGLLMECLDRTEIAVHDAGARVVSMMFYDGSTNTFTMGRNMGWGVSDVIASNNLTANCLIVNGGGTYQAGCIYSDGAWGMLYRAKVPGTQANFAWFNSVGTELMRLNPTNELLLTKDGPGFVQTNGTITVESYVGGSGNGGWFGTRTNHQLMFYTNNASAQMTLKTDGSMTHTTGDNSYMKYGPNATWNANLVVGASPDRSGAGTAQVITTNGNIHIDAGNSTDIYYGYYANARGTPNVHRFFGGDYNFVAVPQNFDAYAHVCVFAGDQMRRSQCMMRQIYREESIAWTGGVNMTYAFYKFNAQCPVKISGKYSMYSTYIGIQNVGMRLYSQTSGAYYYYNFRTYQNLTYVQTTYPFELILTVGDLGAFSTGWFDFYIYGVAGQCQSDGNNQLHVCVQVLPVSDF